MHDPKPRAQLSMARLDRVLRGGDAHDAPEVPDTLCELDTLSDEDLPLMHHPAPLSHEDRVVLVAKGDATASPDGELDRVG